MSLPYIIVCDSAELAVECSLLCAPLALAAAPRLSAEPIREAEKLLLEGAKVALALTSTPTPRQLALLAHVANERSRSLALAIIGAPAEASALRALAADLGLVALSEIRPLLSALALLESGASQPWSASTRSLTALDRLRLGEGSGATARGAGRFERADGGQLSYSQSAEDTPRVIGEPGAIGEALAALRAAAEAAPPTQAVIDDIDHQAVTDILFGPPRALSDPASKTALAPYGLPLPTEELCGSPSRAASEASRIGYPVRIALASPDLRVWDHPDLAADGVDNAARVRDVYRQIMRVASERKPDARLLGVVVTATTRAEALLYVRASPLIEGRVLAEIGFADPHGVASADATLTVIPAEREGLARSLGRLAGASLLLGDSSAQRKARVASLTDALWRVAAFLSDRREQVVSIELNPLAVLVGGAVEAREVCITVGDAFARSLDPIRLPSTPPKKASGGVG